MRRRGGSRRTMAKSHYSLRYLLWLQWKMRFLYRVDQLREWVCSAIRRK